MADRVIQELDEAESLRLIAPAGIGRIADATRFGLAVLPVNYKWHDGAIVFRTARHSALDGDLQRGISGAGLHSGVRDRRARAPGLERADPRTHAPRGSRGRASGCRAGRRGTWPAGERELFLRILPHHVTGRRIKPA